MRTPRHLLLAAFAILAFAGCNKKLAEIDPGDLQDCRNGASAEEAQENVTIAREYALAVAQDVQLSWSPVLYCLDFMFLWAQVLGVLPSEKPVGWTFQDGAYVFGSDTAEIRLTAFRSDDPAAEPITDDILDLESYLKGAKIVVDADTGDTVITFDAAGPLVDLLGLGPAPTSPITLDAQALGDVKASLGKIAIETDYVSYGVAQSIVVDYHTVSPRSSIASIAAEGPLPVDLVAVNASRESTGQELTTSEWNVVRNGQRVEGYTTFSVSGADFPFTGKLDFADAKGLVYATLSLDCE